ncbi:MAG TPA: hypothetical protein VFD90_00505 [Gaiellales bacterium]|nr:hypothetical protein [Gaiellales bacterium]
MVGRGRPLGARRRDQIERAAPLVVVALRHLALEGEELATLGHLHEDTLHTERAELVRDRFIRHLLILTQKPELPQRASAKVCRGKLRRGYC